jgi:hypothetical protein
MPASSSPDKVAATTDEVRDLAQGGAGTGEKFMTFCSTSWCFGGSILSLSVEYGVTVAGKMTAAPRARPSRGGRVPVIPIWAPDLTSALRPDEIPDMQRGGDMAGRVSPVGWPRDRAITGQRAAGPAVPRNIFLIEMPKNGDLTGRR